MENLEKMPKAWRLSRWARLLALLFTAVAAVVAHGVVRAWLSSGQLPNDSPGLLVTLLMGYVMAAIIWAGVTGRVPRFFPLGALKWPLMRSGKLRP